MTVQTHPNVTHDLRMAARQGLLPARGSGWLAGFVNMLGKELGEWFRTRRWLYQLLIWTTIINGFIAFLLFGLPALASIMPEVQSAQEDLFAGLPPELGSVMMFFSIVVMTGGMGAIVLAQDEVIQEKQSGTAAWILSKPAARSAFILTKWCPWCPSWPE
jgi:ABC-2 type transport system permease protein